MPTTWEDINSKLLGIKQEIINQSKRALKKKTPKGDLIKLEIRDNLLISFNDFTKFLKLYWNALNTDQRTAARQIFMTVRDKVVRTFQVLEVSYTVPTSCLEQIDPLLVDDDLPTSDEDEQLENMPLTAVEFFNLASKIVPQDFDGSPDKLRSFLDALNLVKGNADDHSENAVAFIKTRLTGKARDLITDEASVDQIITTLKNGVKGESSRAVASKLLNCRQNTKDSVTYSSEIEALAANLKRAYINEGVPVDTAQLYTTENVVKSLSQNANSERVRIVMEAGSFGTVQEAVAKFVNVNPSSGASNVFYVRQRGNNNFNRNCNNHRSRANFRSNYNRGQNSNYRHNRGNNFSNGNYFSNRNNFSYGNNFSNRNNFSNNNNLLHNNFRGNNKYNQRAIRHYETQDDQPENQPGPQQGRLGEF